LDFRPGDKVLIRTYKSNPTFWDDNGSMFELMGSTGTIEHRLNRLESGARNYKLIGLSWTWREQDLILIENAKPEPNIAFLIKRSERDGIRRT